MSNQVFFVRLELFMLTDRSKNYQETSDFIDRRLEDQKALGNFYKKRLNI